MKTHERILTHLVDNHRPGGYRVEDLARAAGVSVGTARKAILHLDDFRLVRIRSGYTIGRAMTVRLAATDKISAK